MCWLCRANVIFMAANFKLYNLGKEMWCLFFCTDCVGGIRWNSTWTARDGLILTNIYCFHLESFITFMRQCCACVFRVEGHLEVRYTCKRKYGYKVSESEWKYWIICTKLGVYQGKSDIMVSCMVGLVRVCDYFFDFFPLALP